MKERVGGGIAITLFLGGLVTMLVPACDDTPTHLFYGQAYDPTQDCLDTVTAVDTIGGADTGQSCALVCVASPPDPEASTTVVYASTTCPPYPPLFDVSGNNPLCAPALAAAKRQSTCLPDGGVSDPNAIDSGIADATTD